ncbi:PEP-CTERM sorting domain-containing protein [Motiliproteus sp. MSK22-1]|uniref:PEP-CTERM sorting domain-containing protein n=1 Tax=Motiliproteus sp. MSK22-1 TaxID=1897630 RepID=UPI0009785E90|nr:PEP-CTERM sorting domain-containing protein [Motiliproteus sp. MSK22-1]OMH32780.1 hypothetical protein BGP75_14745 [Motiliproteus sp. MSK22-1]
MIGYASKLLAVFAAIISLHSNAKPVFFTYTSEISNVYGLEGITSNEDTITVQVVADNGGSSLVSQTWSELDILSVRLVAGKYKASFEDSWFTSRYSDGIAFETDDMSDLVSVNWHGTWRSDTSTDNFGTGILLSNNVEVRASNGSSVLGSGPGFDTISAWSDPVLDYSVVPEPTSMFLVSLGLVSLCCFRRK